MKLKPRDVDGFLKGRDKFQVALFHGEDEGLVRERSRLLTKNLLGTEDDPFRLTDLSPPDLKENPTRLLDEVLSVTFGGGARIVRLRGAADAQLKAIQAVLDTNIGDGRIILESGQLQARSKLRQTLEKHEAAKVIGCYPDSGKDLDVLIHQVAQEHGLTIDGQASSYLVSHLGADRQISRSELEKLALFCHGTGQITLSDAQTCVGDNAAHHLEDAVFAAADGNLAALERALARVRDEGQSPVAVVRRALSHFQKLHMASDQVNRGMSIDQVVKSQRPPLFFKAADRFKSHLAQWRPKDIETALSILLACEIETKGGAAGPDLSAARALLRLAMAARRTRRGRR